MYIAVVHVGPNLVVIVKMMMMVTMIMIVMVLVVLSIREDVTVVHVELDLIGQVITKICLMQG